MPRDRITGFLHAPPRRRVIISSDVANEADDAFAVAHALLSPSLEVACVIPTHFGDRTVNDSLGASREELGRLLEALEMSEAVNVVDGSDRALPDSSTPVRSAGAQAIVDSVMAAGGPPLFVLCLGPLTDLASALLLEPRLGDADFTAVWVGGPSNPPDPVPLYWPEFNLSNDLQAANLIFRSNIRLWQIPMNTYASCAVSYAELLTRVAGAGRLGQYLLRQLYSWAENAGWDWELKHLPDCAAVGAVLRDDFGRFDLLPAPTFDSEMQNVYRETSRLIRVYQQVDRRYLFEDLFSKIELFAAGNYPPLHQTREGITWGWPPSSGGDH